MRSISSRSIACSTEEFRKKGVYAAEKALEVSVLSWKWDKVQCPRFAIKRSIWYVSLKSLDIVFSFRAKTLFRGIHSFSSPEYII